MSKQTGEVQTEVRIDSFTDFTADIVAMARRNVDLLDGTIESIKRLFEAGEIVIAVWDDPSRLSADICTIKGFKLLREVLRSGRKSCSIISVIPCQRPEQALAIKQMFGTTDEDIDEDEAEVVQHNNHMVLPGVPVWTDRLAPADTANMTATHWLSFADEKAFYGVVVVDDDIEVCTVNAMRNAAKLGCIVPPLHYSEVVMQRLPPGLIPEQFMNRLLTKDEAEHIRGILAELAGE